MTVEDGTSKAPSYCDGTVDDEIIQWDTRADCEVRQILDRVADKWSLLVIALLERQTMRFSELRRAIDGVSQRMLTVTLRHLERDGLVERTIYPEVPPRVEYRLTPMGQSLHEVIKALVVWTEEHQQQISAARDAYDVMASTKPAGSPVPTGAGSASLQPVPTR